MAVRLDEYVIYGRLRNITNYSTHGFIVLRSENMEEPHILHLELTGNVDADLRGKIFSFEPTDPDAPGPLFPAAELRMAPHQVGTTGTMSAQGWVRALPCPVEEYLRRCELGEPPPTPWGRHLYLEWFSQNGRVVIELAGARVEECIREGKDEEDEGDWIHLPNTAPHPDGLEDEETPTGVGITEIRLDEETAHIEQWSPVAPDPEADADTAALQRRLDAEAAALDRQIAGEDAEDDGLAEMELMDYCLDHVEEVPVRAVLRDLKKLPRPDDLDDEAVETQFKALLGEMALAGIALHVCEHFTPREAYRLLLDRILDEERVYRELGGSAWVQNFMTSEYCDACEAEYEAKWEEENRQQEAGDT
jgi:hypothetical protein